MLQVEFAQKKEKEPNIPGRNTPNKKLVGETPWFPGTDTTL